MAEWKKEDFENAVKAISKRAMHDAEFRKGCLANANAAIKEETGKEVPAEFKVRFVENEGANAIFVLPDYVKEGELSDADLEQVAGGAKGAAKNLNLLLPVADAISFKWD